MTSLRVLVVDDEPLVRERVAALVRSTLGLDLVGEARNGLEALDLMATTTPDLVLIDVEMPVLSGFGVIAALGAGPLPGFVFITAFEQYAVGAFEVGAIDYLLKPVTAARFAAAIERARTRLSADRALADRQVLSLAVDAERTRGRRSRYVVRRGYRHHFVGVDEIDWIEAADNYLRLHVGDQSHLVRGTIRDAQAELDPARFVRVHRSSLVAVERIGSAMRRDSGGYELVMRSGARVRVSRQYLDRFRDLLGRDRG